MGAAQILSAANRRWRSWRRDAALSRGISGSVGTVRRCDKVGSVWQIGPENAIEPVEVRLRPSTSDADVFGEVILQEAYNPWFKPITTLVEAGCGVEALSQKAVLIVDCGANIGLSSLYFRLLFPNAQVVSVEADWENFRALCSQPFASAIRPVWAAVNDRVEPLSVEPSEYGSWGTRVRISDGGSGVAAVRIEDLFAELGDTHPPFLVKVDIEGSEERLFRTNLEWLDRTPIVVIELHDWMFPGSPVSANALRAFAERNRVAVTRNGHFWSISPDLLGEAARRSH